MFLLKLLEIISTVKFRLKKSESTDFSIFLNKYRSYKAIYQPQSGLGQNSMHAI